MGMYAAFADLLSYPGAHTVAAVDRCLAATDVTHGGAFASSETGVGQGGALASSETRVGQASALARDLLEFRSNAERLGVAALEEAYTQAFDLEPDSCLYVGHHVFGETTRRSAFMARLSAMYREAGGPDTSGELVDHLPHVLRYLEAHDGTTASAELVSDAVVPALRQILAALDRARHPYAPAVRAVLTCMGTNVSHSTGAGAAV